jgi:hypothetical protein
MNLFASTATMDSPTAFALAGAFGRSEGELALAKIRAGVAARGPFTPAAGSAALERSEEKRRAEAGGGESSKELCRVTVPAIGSGLGLPGTDTRPALCGQGGGMPSVSSATAKQSVRTSQVPGAEKSRTDWPGRNNGHPFPAIDGVSCSVSRATAGRDRHTS